MRKISWAALAALLLLADLGLGAQAQRRPASPPGTAAAQIGTDWIEIIYGRPILRGRTNIFGSGAEYGKTLYDEGPIWRAGANQSTLLRSALPLEIGGKRVPSGDHALLIDLKGPREWTLVVSAQPYQQSLDRANTTGLWGGYNYTPARDVARAPMTVEAMPFSIEQLTWGFTDMTKTGGTLRIWWEKTMASVPFKIVG
jgi:hypothetical protein